MAFKLYAPRRSFVRCHYSVYKARGCERNRKTAKKILEETENTLAAFLLELKEENEKLIENTGPPSSQTEEETKSQTFSTLKNIQSGMQFKKKRIFLNILKV